MLCAYRELHFVVFQGKIFHKLQRVFCRKLFFKHTLAFTINTSYNQLLNFYSRQSVCPMLSF